MAILEMSLSASVLIVVVVVIRALALHRLPKKTFLVLWVVALCRLLIPFSIPSQFSVYTLADMLKARLTAVADIPMIETTPIDIRTTAGVINSTLTEAASVSISPFLAIWIIGICACALFFLGTHLRCRREYKTALPIDNELVKSWQQEHPIRRKVEIRQSDKIAAPLTYGVFRPMVLLPKKTDWTDETRLRYILTHEYVHIRRFDTLTKLALAVAVCMHWFNPFVWVMYVLANRDIELSCDETVVRTFGETIKSAYALTLIGLEEKKSRLTPLVNNFSKNAIEERIVSIMKMKKTSLAGIILALTLVVGTTTVFVTSAAGAATNDSIASGIVMTDNQTGLTSTDGGQTWMDDEEYQKLYPTPDIVWWTYDEYKAELEEDKKTLPNMVGATAGYYDENGVLHEEVITQEWVNEVIARSEQVLEDIKNGAKVSKSVDGDESVGMASDSTDSTDTAHAEGRVLNPSNSSPTISTLISLKNGDTIDFGPYDTKEESYEAVKAYCDEQVKAGKMTQQEADEILSESK